MPRLVISAPVEVWLYPRFGQYDEEGFVPQSSDDADDLLREFKDARYSAWEVRQDFMSKQEPGPYEFVAIYGRFGPDGFDLTLHTQRLVFPRWRSFIAELINRPVLSWGAVRSHFPEFSGILDRPMATYVELTEPLPEHLSNAGMVTCISCRTVLEAILHLIILEKFNGIETRYCERPDCRRQYQLESEHGQKFCKPACQAVMSERRRRARKKLASSRL